MFTIQRLAKLSAGLGTATGLILYFNNDNLNNRLHCATVVNNNKKDFIDLNLVQPVTTKWDYNWDKRDCNKKGETVAPKATRHIILIRHGQYNLLGENDKERTLTELGRNQATFTAIRLKELNLPYTNLIHSTMCRAMETANLIHQVLPNLPVKICSLLEEGAPIPPEPPLMNGKALYHFHQDGARIEAAFRKYFYRADVKQEYDSYDIIVCHANVIRYFVCRALQFPAEGWLRFSLKHASITWLSILPSGRIVLRCYGDTGFMPPHALTSS